MKFGIQSILVGLSIVLSTASGTALAGEENSEYNSVEGYWTLFAESCSELSADQLARLVLDTEVQDREGRRLVTIESDGKFVVTKYTSRECTKVQEFFDSKMGERYCGPKLTGKGVLRTIGREADDSLAFMSYKLDSSVENGCVLPACDEKGSFATGEIRSLPILKFKFREEGQSRGCPVIYQYYTRPQTS